MGTPLKAEIETRVTTTLAAGFWTKLYGHDESPGGLYQFQPLELSLSLGKKPYSNYFL